MKPFPSNRHSASSISSSMLSGLALSILQRQVSQQNSRNSSEVEVLMDFTSEIKFFKERSKKIHRECCKVMFYEVYEASSQIIEFGSIGKKFFIILKGSVEVFIPIDNGKERQWKS